MDPDGNSVSEVMSSPIVTIGPLEDVRKGAEKMRISGIWHLPVVQGGSLDGMVTATDLSKLLPRLLDDEPYGPHIRLI